MLIALVNPINFQENLVKKNENVALLYLKEFLKSHGYDVDIIELKSNYENNSVGSYSWMNKYGIIGISCYYPFNPLKLCTAIRKDNPHALIFAGGPMASLLYKELLFYDSPINAIIVNEGEHSLYELVTQYEKAHNIIGIDGVAVFYNEKILYKKRVFEQNLDIFPFPIRNINSFDQYIPTVISSRGCNGRCTFCSTRYTGNWRGRTPENVFEEIKHIVLTHGQRHFQFVEPNFLQDGARVKKIAQLLNTLNLNITFDFACRIDSIIKNEHAITDLKEAGALKILLGVENFSNSVLKEWQKDITCKQIETAIAILNKQKIAYSISLILFHPKTTTDELIFNVDEIEKLEISENIENLYNSLILIPGTKMNISTQKQEWNFCNPEVFSIFKECIEYKDILDRRASNYDGKDWCDLFETNAFYKRYELNKLKSLLLLPINEPHIKNNSYFVMSKFLRIECTDLNKVCINEASGLVFQINQVVINLLGNLDGRNVIEVLHELASIERSFCNERKKLLKMICFLLRNRFLIIVEE